MLNFAPAQRFVFTKLSKYLRPRSQSYPTASQSIDVRNAKLFSGHNRSLPRLKIGLFRSCEEAIWSQELIHQLCKPRSNFE